MSALLEEDVLPTPRLHLRLVRQAVPAPQRVTGKNVSRVALELAMRMPLGDAIAKAIRELSEPKAFDPQQIEHIAGIAVKLISEGLRVDDAVSVALHEPPHVKPSVPMPEALKNHLFPPQLTGQNVMKLALELNHGGLNMDDSIVTALKKFAAPKEVTHEQCTAVLEAAQTLFKDGRQIAEAFDIALKKTLPKGGV